MNSDTPQSVPSPSIAEHGIDTATDVSRTVDELSAALQSAIGQLRTAIADAERPGKPIATLRAFTREAPLASLFAAFLLGVMVARRR